MEDITEKVIKFKVGEEVYSPHFGKGIVTGIDTNSLFIYPIHVEWTDKKRKGKHRHDIFTPEGFYSVSFHDPDMDISLVKEKPKEPEFKIMDRVFYPFYGKGTVVAAWKTDEPYPIRVFWDKPYFADEPWSSFTRDGVMSLKRIEGADKFKLMLLKDIPKEETGGSEVGQIASVINSNIAKKMKEDNEKMSVMIENLRLESMFGLPILVVVL